MVMIPKDTLLKREVVYYTSPQRYLSFVLPLPISDLDFILGGGNGIWSRTASSNVPNETWRYC